MMFWLKLYNAFVVALPWCHSRSFKCNLRFVFIPEDTEDKKYVIEETKQSHEFGKQANEKQS